MIKTIDDIYKRVHDLLDLERYVYLELSKNVLKNGSVNIALTAKTTPYRPDELTVTLLKIQDTKNGQSISLSSLHSSILKKYGLMYTVQKDTFLRVDYDMFVKMLFAEDSKTLDLFETISDPSIAKAFLNDLLEIAFSNYSFGCCGFFKECSAQLSCVCADKVYALGCSYRKHLMKGNNFLL